MLQNEEETDFHIPSREQLVYDKVKRLNQGPLTNDSLSSIYREVMSASIKLQKEISISYLGPPGSYSHQASFQKFGDSVCYSSCQTINEVFSSIEKENTTYGLVPFENSTFGSVQQTLDRFITTNLFVRGEIFLEIKHCLLNKSGSKSDIKKIYSHPEAFGQCTKYLESNFPNVEKINVESTSKAAEMSSLDSESASICSIVCQDIYNLKIIEENIQDLKNNTTRFFILGRKPDFKTNNDKTLLSFTVDHRQPGALCDCLLKKINLTKIDSRPSGQRLWHYFFFIELVGHVEDENVKEALEELGRYCLDIKVL
ncbi:hypothetical protein HK099_003078, partial [Clydaea vesicula]